MAEETILIHPSQEPSINEMPGDISQPPGPYRSRWSLCISAVCASLLVTALGAILWSSATLPKLDRLENPDQALALMVGRMMEAQDGLQRLPEWRQRLTEWMSGDNDTERTQAIEWYRELAHAKNDRLSKFRLAILLGEFRSSSEAVQEAKSWKVADGSMEPLRELIEAAYDDFPLAQPRETELQALLAETIPNGWFYNHLAVRLAKRADDQELLRTIEQQIALKGDHAQRWSGPLVDVELLCLIIGSLILVTMIRQRQQLRDQFRLHTPGIPPPWSGETGAAVLLRGGALGAAITVAFLSVPSFEHASLRALAIPLANLPLLALAYTQLLKPAGLNFRDGFGLCIDRTQLGQLSRIVLAVVAAGLWGEWVMGRATEFFGLSNHWTEWFDPDLVWAPPSGLAISLLEYIVFAPIFEEIAFRGLLYAMLRRRFSFLPAAVISTSLFALAHGYGVIGFISVFWSGFLWAWIYERTGSLIPGMIAHATNNFLVCLMVMMLLR